MSYSISISDNYFTTYLTFNKTCDKNLKRATPIFNIFNET